MAQRLTVKTNAERIAQCEERIAKQAVKLSKATKASEREKIKKLLCRNRQELQKLSASREPEPLNRELIKKTTEFSLNKHLENLAAVYQTQGVDYKSCSDLLKERVDSLSREFANPNGGLSYQSYLNHFSSFADSVQAILADEILNLVKAENVSDDSIKTLQTYYENIGQIGDQFVDSLIVDAHQINSLGIEESKGFAEGVCAKATSKQIERLQKNFPKVKANFFETVLEIQDLTSNPQLAVILDSAEKFFSNIDFTQKYYAPLREFVEERLYARKPRVIHVKDPRIKSVVLDVDTPSGLEKARLINQYQLLDSAEKNLPKAIASLFQLLHPAVDSLAVETSLLEVIDQYRNKLLPVIESIDTDIEALDKKVSQNIINLTSLDPGLIPKLEQDLGLKDLKDSLSAQGVDLLEDGDPAVHAIQNFLYILNLRANALPLI